MGSFVPGFALALLVLIRFRDEAGALVDANWILSDRFVFYAAFVLFSFLLGLLNIQIVFRLLDALGGGIDRLTSRLKDGRMRNAIEFCSNRLHLFNLRTLAEETKAHFPDETDLGQKDEYAGAYWAAKMRVLASSRALTKEAAEIEGEINFLAGMFTPLVIFSIAYRPFWPAGALALLVALFFLIRFQHLRHDDIAFVSRAAKSLHFLDVK